MIFDFLDHVPTDEGIVSHVGKKKQLFQPCRTTTYSTDQSDQLKNIKFYENSSEYANFSKTSGQDHKTKGQIL